jgi:hypothetical protein
VERAGAGAEGTASAMLHYDSLLCTCFAHGMRYSQASGLSIPQAEPIMHRLSTMYQYSYFCEIQYMYKYVKNSWSLRCLDLRPYRPRPRAPRLLCSRRPRASRGLRPPTLRHARALCSPCLCALGRGRGRRGFCAVGRSRWASGSARINPPWREGTAPSPQALVHHYGQGRGRKTAGIDPLIPHVVH